MVCFATSTAVRAPAAEVVPVEPSEEADGLGVTEVVTPPKGPTASAERSMAGRCSPECWPMNALVPSLPQIDSSGSGPPLWTGIYEVRS